MFGPGLRIRQGTNGQPIRTTHDCQCACHREPGGLVDGRLPKATEARVCTDCAAEMFQPWTDILESIT